MVSLSALSKVPPVSNCLLCGKWARADVIADHINKCKGGAYK